MIDIRKMLKLGLPAVALVLVTACTPSLKHQVTAQDKSVILAGIEVIPDYEPGFFASRPETFYGLSVVIGGGDQKKSKPFARTYRDRDANIRWVAIAVDPGSYVFSRIIERGVTGELFVSNNRRTTRFLGIFKTPTFTVGEDEIVYIGTSKSNIVSKPALFGARLLVDAHKTYGMEAARAQSAIKTSKIPSGTFRAQNIFEGNAEALSILSETWASRDWD